MRKYNDYKTEEIKIESGIDKPNKGGHRTAKWYLIFDKLNIGDSFAIPYLTIEEAYRIQIALVNAKRNYILNHNKYFKGSTRIIFNKKEVRFWRD